MKRVQLENAAPQSGHSSPLPWRLEVDAYGTNIVAANDSRVAYVHSCSCNGEADSDAGLIVTAVNQRDRLAEHRKELGDDREQLIKALHALLPGAEAAAEKLGFASGSLIAARELLGRLT